MEFKTPSYSTVSDRLGVSKPKAQSFVDKVPSQATDKPASNAMPVAEMTNTSKSSVPTSPAPIKSAFDNSLDGIKTKALEIQKLLNERQSTQATPVEATPVETQPLSQRDQVLQEFMNVNSVNNADAKQAIREEEQLAQKRAFANDLYNEMLQSEQAYKDRRNALEKNPEGKLRGALNDELNDLSVEFSRQRANDMISYNIALGDFRGAEESVNARIADMDADLNRRSNMLAQVYQFLGDDLTESEKLQVNQAFEKEMADKQVENQKELARYDDELARSRALFTASLNPVEEEVVVDQTDSLLNTVGFMRESIEAIKGGLYKGASQGEASKFIAELVRGTSKEAQLRSYADTLKSNMLSIATDPSIKQFFGPQMSDADVRLMTASATNLNVDDMTPKQILAETNRIEEFIGKYESAVKAKASGRASQPGVMTAPDGREVIIID